MLAVSFVALYAAHQVGDHWFQTPTQALSKGGPGWAARAACARHVAVLAAVKAAALWAAFTVTGLPARPAWWAVGLGVDAVSHYWADRRSTLRRLAAVFGPGKAAFFDLGSPRAGHDDNPTLGTGACAVRGFAVHLHTLNPVYQAPPADLLPRQYTRLMPYLFSDEEVTALMRAAGRMRHGPAGLTYQTLIGLLAVTGLRPSEAYRLDRGHFDPDDATLTVVRSKYGKSRQLVLDPSTITALLDYGRHRDRHYPHPVEPSLLVSMQRTRLNVISTERSFVRLAHAVGIRPRSDRTRPRLKDLRHTFAVNTLISWYRSGADVDTRLPALSTWLGHVDPEATYWYLQASPELLALAAERADRHRAQEAPP
ncbi:tyrosine-type recombinase/integrase [Catenulispora sp. GAS73]|uniref:tyrosine-type recombinase/integrase n=1 Tax=Catenulispora sp. GAS73 TaxID=3156269 RepID=UPI003510EF08